MKSKKISLLFIVCFGIMSSNVFGQDSLPIINIDDFVYQGAFRIPSGSFDSISADYTEGIIAVNHDNNSLYLCGHDWYESIGEFSIPTLVNSTDINDLNIAENLQPFKDILDLATNGNPFDRNLISGMLYENNKLYVNAVTYYDCNTEHSLTTLVVETPSDIANSEITGYYTLDGFCHASGWISQVPEEWLSSLGGDHICGNSSKYPINTRSTIGISAFSFNISDISGNPDTISTTTLLDFDLANMLCADYNSYQNPRYNLISYDADKAVTGHTAEDVNAVPGDNNLWTEVSQASYGFIVPGTRTYFTVGASGGHNFGIGYKAKQSNGHIAGGPCAYDASDYYNYYWLWDVNDLLAVKNGTKNEYDIRPYAYGEFDVPFQYDNYKDTAEFHEIIGGCYDKESGLLYLTIKNGLSISAYGYLPVIVAYKIDVPTESDQEIEQTDITLYPNPAHEKFTVSDNQKKLEKIEVYDVRGVLIKETTNNEVNVSAFSAGTYVVKIFISGNIVTKKLVVE